MLHCGDIKPRKKQDVILGDGIKKKRLEAQKGVDMCILTADLVVVQKKLTQHCKAIILQLRKK